MFNSLFKKLSGQNQDNNKPKQVATAVMLLYIGFILSMITDWLDGIGIIPFIIVFIVISMVITAISAGKKWARILILLFVIFNLVSFGFNIAQLLSHGVKEKTTNLVMVLYGIEIVIELIALRLLFSKPANSWFNEQGEMRGDV
jgi:ABC-type iron transport system FetAB permease component